LADTCEALIAALYLDGGLDAARQFIVRELAERIEEVRQPGYSGRDHKSRLQERLQALGHGLPAYRVIAEAGPEHRKVFQVEIVADDRLLAQGSGRTKKDAEQEAARLALEALDPPLPPD